MNGAAFADLIREKTRTNSSTLTTTELLVLVNSVKEDLAQEIMKRDEGIFGMWQTMNLTASDDTMASREYPLPYENMEICEVRAALDINNPTVFTTLREFNPQQMNKPFDIHDLNNFSSCPSYEVFRQSIWIYAKDIYEIEDGLQLKHIVFPADVTADDITGTNKDNDLSIDLSGLSPRIPRNFHIIWATMVSKMYKENREKPLPLTEGEQQVTETLKDRLDGITNPILERENLSSLPDDSFMQI